MSGGTERPENLHTAAANIAAQLVAFRNAQGAKAWSGSFAEYFGLAVANPNVAMLSHGRVADMIMAGGVEDSVDGQPPRYNFFKKEIFGLERPLARIVDYFTSAAQGLETRKRILMLMGPVGGGKSTIVTMLKKGLEAYSKTEPGAVYAIEGCPMNEEPLHLIPDSMRPAVLQEYGLHIEGGLCPHCRQMLVDKYAGKTEDVKVARITFSEAERRGIGTFSPSDPKSQDISELTGSIDLATVGEYGSESDPRAYRFDGELNVANRGMMEFIEMLKSDEKFLYGLLTLSQEQNIKTGRFAMIYADEVVVSHTNEAEYATFLANQKAQALRDRLIVIPVPYNLRVSDEAQIYGKLLAESAVGGRVHIAPDTLRVAATFAVLSRLESSKKAGMTPMTKLKLYDGGEVANFSQKDVRELEEEAEREGMDGIGPRFIVNQLSTAVSRKGVTCLTPIDALRAIKVGIEQDPGIDKEQRDQYLGLIAQTRKDYDNRAKTEVQKAFVYSFEDTARTLCLNYLENVTAYTTRVKLRDPLTDADIAPDEKLMRSVEEQMGITENAKNAFRQEVLIRVAALALGGKAFDYKSHDQLREAIEKKLFADLQDVVKITTSSRIPDAEQLKKMNVVAGRLATEGGYCSHCANQLLKYVGDLLNR